MPVGIVGNLLTTIDSLLTNAINGQDAVKAIGSLSLSRNESKYAEALCSLIRKLPSLPIEEEVNEFELCSRFIEPFLSGLFDNPDGGVYLRWTNEMTLKRKHTEISKVCALTCTSQRRMAPIGTQPSHTAKRRLPRKQRTITWCVVIC